MKIVGGERQLIAAHSIPSWGACGTGRRRHGQIGTNGCPSTAEYSTDPMNTCRELEQEFQLYHNVAIRDLAAYGQSNRLSATYAAYGAKPIESATDVCGNHIHITCNDSQWYFSKQASITMNFYLSLVSLICDKHNKVRHNRGYGTFGNVHTSPGGDKPGTEQITVNRREWYAWRGGFLGYEYRMPACMLAPSNQAYRDAIWTTIEKVLGATGAEEQLLDSFYKKFGRNLGFTAAENDWPYETGDRGGERSRWQAGTIDHWSWNKWDNQMYQHTRDFVTILGQTFEEVPVPWLQTILEGVTPTNPFKNLNPPEFILAYRREAATGMIALANAWRACGEAYEAFTRARSRAVWFNLGDKFVQELGIRWRSEADPNDPAAPPRPRDACVPEIATLAAAIAAEAYRKLTRQKLTGTANFEVLGARDDRGNSSDRVFADRGFIMLEPVRQAFAREQFTLNEAASGTYMIKLALRESESTLRYIPLALYILYRCNKIAEIETQEGEVENGGGLGALFG